MTDAAFDLPETLDAVVRRADPDRWLASRFIADPQARADVVALYALNDELARIAPAVSNPLIGEIRLAWWREAVDEMVEGRSVRRHPVAEAVAAALARRNLDPARLYAMIAARGSDLDDAPFADEAALHLYLDAVPGGLMALAAQALGAPALSFVAIGRAWGVAGLARAHWLAGARNRLPPDWDAARVMSATSAAVAASADEIAAAPVSAFPALAYAALAQPYARRRDMTDLEKRARLVWATMRGRL